MWSIACLTTASSNVAHGLTEALRALLRVPDPLLRYGDHVLAAVSGGPDSLALLHALDSLRGEIGLLGLLAAHFNHGLRGQEADDDAAFVAGFCAARGIPCFVGKADVAQEAAQAHVSVQQAARTARYRFLARVAQECGASTVATAHTQDDQAETVLLHVLRGTGLDGLRGIPARRGLYVRPLLGVSRAQTEAYCAAHALLPRTDTSNSDTSHYTRNRVRHDLLPLLERDYHPGVRPALLRLAQTASADADFLQAHAQAVLGQATMAQTVSPPGLTLSRDTLRALHPALRPRVLRAALAQVRGSTENITHHHLAQIDQALLSPAETAWGMTTPTPLCHVTVRANTLTLAMPGSAAAGADSAYSAYLPLGGSAQMPGAGQCVRAELRGFSALPPPASSTAVFDALPASSAAVFDAQQVHLPSLHVRSWQPGDRLAPRGLAGHTQKVQDIFTNAKVPRHLRAQVPIVADQDGLLWVAGLAASERAQITQATQHCLVLTAAPLPSRE